MAFFTTDQLTKLSQTTVRVAPLVEFGYSPVLRLWNGEYELTAGGYQWQGLGGLGGIDGLAEMREATSAQVKFTLSGTDDAINALAVMTAAEQAGKTAQVFFQLFDADWQVVASPIPVWTGITQPLTVTSQSGEEGKGRQTSITLPAENLFFARSRPPAGLNTDRDQQQRFPGDLFFEYITQMKNKTYVWPT